MYTIHYDSDVIDIDFKVISKSRQKKIILTIEKKLAVAPSQYGKPLRSPLKNFWKLKIGADRVVFQINEPQRKVTVFHIGPRKDNLVYAETMRRVL